MRTGPGPSNLLINITKGRTAWHGERRSYSSSVIKRNGYEFRSVRGSRKTSGKEQRLKMPLGSGPHSDGLELSTHGTEEKVPQRQQVPDGTIVGVKKKVGRSRKGKAKGQGEGAVSSRGRSGHMRATNRLKEDYRSSR